MSMQLEYNRYCWPWRKQACDTEIRQHVCMDMYGHVMYSAVQNSWKSEVTGAYYLHAAAAVPYLLRIDCSIMLLVLS